MPNGISLLRTGGANPSPVYSPELNLFDGWKRQPATVTRLAPRARMLEHPGHTPAVPLAGRRIPPMETWQVQPFPQTIVFAVSITAASAEIHTSDVLPTPSIITQMTISHNIATILVDFQVALTSTVIATDAEFSSCPLIFKLAPETQGPLAPLRIDTVSNAYNQHIYQMGQSLPHGTRNRIALRIYNNAAVDAYLGIITFNILPI